MSYSFYTELTHALFLHVSKERIDKINMAVSFKQTEDTLTAVLSGEIDHHTAAEFRACIDREAERLQPSLLILDFSGIGFMDSSGIGLIMGRYKNAAEYGGKIQVVNAPPMIERMIKLAGIGRLDVLK